MEAIGAAGTDIAGAVGCSEWQPDKGFEATQRLLRGKQTPTALICFNDRLALGAYQALAEAGLDVPRDVSVVSFDDDVIASWIKPQLTTLALPHYELGHTAIEILLAQSDAPSNGQPQIHRIPMPLRERGSVRRRESNRTARRAASADPAGAAQS